MVKIGDRIDYWRGSILAEGIVKRIELAPEPEWKSQELLADGLVLCAANGAHFVDLEDGRWTYADRIVAVNGVRV
jgi:hypothetical protein